MRSIPVRVFKAYGEVMKWGNEIQNHDVFLILMLRGRQEYDGEKLSLRVKFQNCRWYVNCTAV